MPNPTSSPIARNPLAFWHWKLHWQIIVGLLIGALIGWAMGAHAVSNLQNADPASAGKIAAANVTASGPYMVFKLLADLFINGLKLIIVPLVTSSIILAVAGLGSGSNFGRLGGKTLFYYMCTSLLAILVGLVLIDIVKPGIGPDGKGILVGRDLSAFQDAQAEVAKKVQDRGASAFLDVFRKMIPDNIFSAAVSEQLLGIIVVSLFIGFFLARLANEPSRVVLQFTQGVYDVTLRISGLVLALAPIGVLALLAVTIGEQYAKLVPDGRFANFLTGILLFAAVALTGLLFHVLVNLFLILRFIARVKPTRHFKAMLPALTTAFSTASSNATLPLTMECAEERAGISRSTTSFVLPLGATVNMDGTALYECVAAIFICQAFGLDLSFAQQFMIVVIALVTSIGVAGVPAASLVAIVIILQAVQAGLPPGILPEGASLIAGLGLLFIFDRPLDMCRTAVNIYSDSCGAAVVARSEGEPLTPIS
jgi:Na+/H+-dicarboxylate symporter